MSEQGLSRRRHLLGVLGLGAAIGAARAALAASPTAGGAPSPAAAGGPLPLARGRSGRVKLVLEVAVLGHTDAPTSAGQLGDRQSRDYFNIDTRGGSYYVEGLVYPAGTIPKPTERAPISVFREAPPRLNNQVVWDFTTAQPTGHWLNRGWVMINGNRTPYRDVRGTVIETARTEPHMLSEHTFVLGVLSPTNISPELLITSGLENGNNPDEESMVRAVIGGTRRFAHASGEVVVTRIGRNTSLLRSFADKGDVMSPNYRYEFDLKLG